jgi:hypothetical protein
MPTPGRLTKRLGRIRGRDSQALRAWLSLPLFYFVAAKAGKNSIMTYFGSTRSGTFLQPESYRICLQI